MKNNLRQGIQGMLVVINFIENRNKNGNEVNKIYKKTKGKYIKRKNRNIYLTCSRDH